MPGNNEPPVIPALTEGTTLHGEYEGGGYDEPRYLIARARREGDGAVTVDVPTGWCARARRLCA
jgi:hypothetical protein